MPGAEFPAAPSRLSGASISGPGHSQNFLGIPTLAPLGQSLGRAEIFLSPGHQAWDRPQEPRGHFKMLCVMETFKHSLQWRTHSDLWAIPRFTVTQATLTTCPRHPALLDLIRSMLIPRSRSSPKRRNSSYWTSLAPKAKSPLKPTRNEGPLHSLPPSLWSPTCTSPC